MEIDQRSAGEIECDLRRRVLERNGGPSRLRQQDRRASLGSQDHGFISVCKGRADDSNASGPRRRMQTLLGAIMRVYPASDHAIRAPA